MIDAVVVFPFVPVTPKMVKLRAGFPYAVAAATAAAPRPSRTTSAGSVVRPASSDDRDSGAALGSGIEEVMTVTVPTAHRNEQLTALHLAAVVRDAARFARELSLHTCKQSPLG